VLFRSPASWTQLYWFALLPLAGGLLWQHRGTLTGGLIGVVAAAAVLAARGAEFPGSDFVQSVADVAIFIISVVGLTTVYVRLQNAFLGKAERAARARQAFLAQMSHELRTPMNGVLGVLQLVEGDDPLPRQREQLGLIRRSGEAMVALVDELLDFARLEAGGLEVVKAPFDARQIVTDVTGLYAPDAATKGVTLTASVADAVPPVLEGDALRVRQVLQNLVNNAVKFTSRGAVRCEARWAADVLTLEVVDEGIGLSAQQQERLFTPFRQADADTATRYGGTGLGLVIVRGLCRLMGGDVTVRSAPGQGSTFTATCQAKVASASLAPPTLAQPRRFTGHVLVVDDNDVNRLVAVRLCQRLGLTTSTADDGEGVLEALAREPADLVLMDCQMPRVDGLEATRRLRRAPAFARVPVIAVTASAMPEEVQRCLEAGMNEVVAKPIDAARLEAVLERHLASSGDPAGVVSSS
jgi:signal transduction histidine kinase/ActR/RegA family two-component response regulator